MPDGHDYAEQLAELRRHVSEPVRGIILLEFATVPQLASIISELQALDPARPCIEVAYDPPRENAVVFLDRVRSTVAETAHDHTLPLLILKPVQLPDAAADNLPARDFWQAMNFRRETLGALPAQILLCVDPWHHQRITEYAADLRSWTTPKFHLLPPAGAVLERTDGLAALSSFAQFNISPEAAEARWQSFWPLLQQAKAEGSVNAAHFSRYVVPLFESALALGNLVRARQVREAVGKIKLGDSETIEWHRLNAMLACAEQDFATAEEHTHKVLKMANGHSDESLRKSAFGALWKCANLLSNFGQSQSAEPFRRELCEISEKFYGPEHRDTLACRGNLANTLCDQGKYAEAEQEDRERIKIEERVLGAEHSDTLLSRVGVADALQAQGKSAEAEEEYRAVLKILERVLGAEHRDTLATRNNLANALSSQGKHAEAEQENRAGLKNRERVLGAEHPDTLASRNNLANVLKSQGKYAEAEQEYRAVLKIQERVMGAEHPNTLVICYNLALCIEVQKKLNEALEILRRAEAGRVKVLGAGHPDSKNAKAARERIEAALKAQ